MLGEKCFTLCFFTIAFDPKYKCPILYYYLNLVVFPQGVRGYFIDFVRPPWG